jgi:hypothetical protein
MSANACYIAKVDQLLSCSVSVPLHFGLAFVIIVVQSEYGAGIQ